MGWEFTPGIMGIFTTGTGFRMRKMGKEPSLFQMVESMSEILKTTLILDSELSPGQTAVNTEVSGSVEKNMGKAK